jgi:hypothetical protein
LCAVNERHESMIMMGSVEFGSGATTTAITFPGFQGLIYHRASGQPRSRAYSQYSPAQIIHAFPKDRVIKNGWTIVPALGIWPIA